MDAFEALTDYYSTHDEDGRLASKHGSIEFLTTVRYVEKYLSPGMKLLEIGAGTGRYSHYFARKGYPVDAVELIEHNVEVFKANTRPNEPVTIRQGNATALYFIPSDCYEITLLLGPMYHLFTEEDKRKALAEALRVTKPGGLLYVAYCMNEPTIMGYCFERGNLKRVIDNGLLDPKTYKTSSTPEELLVLYRREEIDALIIELNVKRLRFVGTDMYTRYYRPLIDGMDDDIFELYLNYHFVICERTDMTGISHHTLDVLKKG